MIPLSAKPSTFEWLPAHSALLLIDMQRDFLEPGGFGDTLGNDVTRLQAIVPTVQTILTRFREWGLPVIHTLECHAADLSDCPPAKLKRGKPSLRIGDPGLLGRILIRGEPGNAIIPELAPLPSELVIEKPGKGAFYQTELEAQLRSRGIQQLIVGGVTTEVCVQTTLREAMDRGFDCLLLEDCTESYFAAFKDAVVAMVSSQGGIVGWTGTSSAFLSLPKEQVQAEIEATGFPSSNSPPAPPYANAVRTGVWIEIQPGLRKRSLIKETNGSEVALLSYQPGATAPLHLHVGREQIWILEGSQQDEAGVYPAGTYVDNPAGSTHSVASPGGCLILIAWDAPVKFI